MSSMSQLHEANIQQLLMYVDKLKKSISQKESNAFYLYSELQIVNSIIQDKRERQIQNLESAKERASKMGDYKLFAIISQDIRTLQNQYKYAQ